MSNGNETKVGIFYGTTTGNTEDVANKMLEIIGEDKAVLHNIGEADVSDFEKYDFLILGTPTWNDGDLQEDWDGFFSNLDDIDFNGKTVALFGLGDQVGYGNYFCDGIGTIYDKLIEKGAKVVGEWPTDGYEHSESLAERDGKFIGLPLDEDNESDKTDERIDQWLKQIGEHFGF